MHKYALGEGFTPTAIHQNADDFQFTDDLFGTGMTYETAGALRGRLQGLDAPPLHHRRRETAPDLVVINSYKKVMECLCRFTIC